MINYYAYSGKKSLIESKSNQTNSFSMKSQNIDFVIKTCNKKFGEGNYRLYNFTNFNDNKTFKEIT